MFDSVLNTLLQRYWCKTLIWNLISATNTFHINLILTVPTEIFFLTFSLLLFVFSVLLLIATSIFRPKLLKVVCMVLLYRTYSWKHFHLSVYCLYYNEIIISWTCHRTYLTQFWLMFPFISSENTRKTFSYIFHYYSKLFHVSKPIWYQSSLSIASENIGKLLVFWYFQWV